MKISVATRLMIDWSIHTLLYGLYNGLEIELIE